MRQSPKAHDTAQSRTVGGGDALPPGLPIAQQCLGRRPSAGSPAPALRPVAARLLCAIGGCMPLRLRAAPACGMLATAAATIDRRAVTIEESNCLLAKIVEELGEAEHHWLSSSRLSSLAPAQTPWCLHDRWNESAGGQQLQHAQCQQPRRRLHASRGQALGQETEEKARQPKFCNLEVCPTSIFELGPPLRPCRKTSRRQLVTAETMQVLWLYSKLFSSQGIEYFDGERLPEFVGPNELNLRWQIIFQWTRQQDKTSTSLIFPEIIFHGPSVIEKKGKYRLPVNLLD
ncbi:unnamed protein product [Miscanthus lutarioriparius]|uniref:Uncharacterized protein n=1 Tax=Miscanthus lutarioriparius TaxID=422564 RepID=A0A811Q083_9POAL|nr:unnamed protein product [Miscanthus lutarioriparius]